MVRNFTTALVAALVLGSAGIASARRRASSITTCGPIRRTRSRTAICPAGPANNHTKHPPIATKELQRRDWWHGPTSNIDHGWRLSQRGS